MSINSIEEYISELVFSAEERKAISAAIAAAHNGTT